MPLTLGCGVPRRISSNVKKEVRCLSSNPHALSTISDNPTAYILSAFQECRVLLTD